MFARIAKNWKVACALRRLFGKNQKLALACKTLCDTKMKILHSSQNIDRMYYTNQNIANCTICLTMLNTFVIEQQAYDLRKEQAIRHCFPSITGCPRINTIQL